MRAAGRPRSTETGSPGSAPRTSGRAPRHPVDGEAKDQQRESAKDRGLDRLEGPEPIAGLEGLNHVARLANGWTNEIAEEVSGRVLVIWETQPPRRGIRLAADCV